MKWSRRSRRKKAFINFTNISEQVYSVIVQFEGNSLCTKKHFRAFSKSFQLHVCIFQASKLTHCSNKPRVNRTFYLLLIFINSEKAEMEAINFPTEAAKKFTPKSRLELAENEPNISLCQG